MIYFYEFLKGMSLALLIFGAFYFFTNHSFSFSFLCLGATPGLLLLIVSVLLIENHELRKKQE
ncbi:hypothetical protein [Campylobacter troglodytis]|uniref:hypothetical protein n=1 Tax=Campylobacter troglodytis TaxID=654363 RepID=UPI001159E491|nr:hypothetical protein [Campylobacter troglodytis]TQR60411.1 hypothetical protein DMC01_05820 [Campylobacter troglodytis]